MTKKESDTKININFIINLTINVSTFKTQNKILIKKFIYHIIDMVLII